MIPSKLKHLKTTVSSHVLNQYFLYVGHLFQLLDIKVIRTEMREFVAHVSVKVLFVEVNEFFFKFKQKEECTKKIRELGSLPADAFEKHQKTPVKTVSCK